MITLLCNYNEAIKKIVTIYFVVALYHAELRDRIEPDNHQSQYSIIRKETVVVRDMNRYFWLE